MNLYNLSLLNKVILISFVLVEIILSAWGGWLGAKKYYKENPQEWEEWKRLKRRSNNMKVKKVFKYGTGQEIPEGAIYLYSCKNGKMCDPNYPLDYEFVWHYFIVEVEG